MPNILLTYLKMYDIIVFTISFVLPSKVISMLGHLGRERVLYNANCGWRRALWS